MFNISDKIEIVNLEKTNCKRGHIEHCVVDQTRHDEPRYTYFGSKVQKGTMILHTVKGDFKLKFDVKNAWARKLEFII